MAIPGTAQAQCVQHHELARRVGEMIIAAQHLCDTHDRIVDGIAEEEGGSAVVAANDEVADVAGREALRPMHRIDEFNDLIFGNGKSQRRLQAPSLTLDPLSRRQMPAGPRIAWWFARHALQLSRQFQILRRAIARVRPAAFLQLREQSSIEFTAFRLRVRCRRTPDVRPLVPVQTQPAQFPHQLVPETKLAALDIGVLDAQNKPPAAFSRPKMAEKSGSSIAQMQGTGRTGRKPCGDG